MKNKKKNIIIFIFILFCSITIVGSFYYNIAFPKQDFDVVIFTLFAGVENTSPDVVNGIISYCAPQVIVLLVILLLTNIKKGKDSIYIDIKFRKKNYTFKLFPIGFTSKHRIIYSIILFIISICIFVKCFYVDEFIQNRFQSTKIFEEYYVDARNIKIEFPSKKRNLILILGESFENTVFSKKNGGACDYSLMPELETLALKNTSFSNTETIGGAVQVYGTTYSAAGNVAITSATPLKAQDFLLDANDYTGNGNYLSGVYSLRRSSKR